MSDYVIGNPEVLRPAFRGAHNLQALRELAEKQGLKSGQLQLQDRGVTDHKFNGGVVQEQGVTVRDSSGAEMDCGVTKDGAHCGPVHRPAVPGV